MTMKCHACQKSPGLLFTCQPVNRTETGTTAIAQKAFDKKHLFCGACRKPFDACPTCNATAISHIAVWILSKGSSTTTSPRTDRSSAESKESMSKGPSPRTDCDYNSDSDVDVEDMGYFG